jgi:hypothetical protein
MVSGFHDSRRSVNVAERAAILHYAYIAYLVKFIFWLLFLAQFAFGTLLSVLNVDACGGRRREVDFFRLG